MKDLYTIGQLAKLAGISTKTLRVYERKGLLTPERNMENSYRMYGEEAVRTLEKIQLMKYLDFSLDQIAEFLQLYENVSREEMLLAQKRLLEQKREQLNTVIARVDRAVRECRLGEQDSNGFLKSLGTIVRNQRADEVVSWLMRYSDEPGGWSRFIFENAGLGAGMQVLDAGAGYGNLWRCNMERLPEQLSVTCVDKHNTHMDTFCQYVQEQENAGTLEKKAFRFVWDDLEAMSFAGDYDRIFFNHVVFYMQDRKAMYEKLAAVLKENGTFICTWGGFLFYEKLQVLLREFLEDCTELDKEYYKHEKKTKELEKELRQVFPVVEQHVYVINLHFATAEEFLDYILQVCRPVREILEVKRAEFLKLLDGLDYLKNNRGGYEFQRDTYLYTCKNKED